MSRPWHSSCGPSERSGCRVNTVERLSRSLRPRHDDSRDRALVRELHPEQRAAADHLLRQLVTHDETHAEVECLAGVGVVTAGAVVGALLGCRGRVGERDREREDRSVDRALHQPRHLRLVLDRPIKPPLNLLNGMGSITASSWSQVPSRPRSRAGSLRHRGGRGTPRSGSPAGAAGGGHGDVSIDQKGLERVETELGDRGSREVVGAALPATEFAGEQRHNGQASARARQRRAGPGLERPGERWL